MKLAEAKLNVFGKFQKLESDVKLYAEVRLHCKQNLKDMVNKECFIYRGYDSEVPYQVYVGGRQRQSANTENYYTLFMDNLPSWNGYPKRSESLICTNYDKDSYAYGNSHIIIPFDGTVIGVCETNDVWSSFSRVTANFDIANMSSFGNFLLAMNSVLTKIGTSCSDITVPRLSDTSWQVLSASLALWSEAIEITQSKMEDFIEDFNRGFHAQILDSALAIIRNVHGPKYQGDFMAYFNDIMSPFSNGFTKGMVAQALSNDVTHEVWFSGNALILANTPDMMKFLITIAGEP